MAKPKEPILDVEHWAVGATFQGVLVPRGRSSWSLVTKTGVKSLEKFFEPFDGMVVRIEILGNPGAG